MRCSFKMVPSKDASRILTTLGWRHSVRMLISVKRNSRHCFLLTICFILIILMATYLLVWRSIASLTLKKSKLLVYFCNLKDLHHTRHFTCESKGFEFNIWEDWKGNKFCLKKVMCTWCDLGQPSILTFNSFKDLFYFWYCLWFMESCWYLLCISSFAYRFDDQVPLIEDLSDGRCHVVVPLVLVIQVSLLKLMILLVWFLVRMVIVHISIKKNITNVC